MADRTRQRLKRWMKGKKYVPGFGITRQTRQSFRDVYEGERHGYQWRVYYHIHQIVWEVWKEGEGSTEGGVRYLFEALAWIAEVIEQKTKHRAKEKEKAKAKRNKRRRERYQEDPEYRARRLEENQRYFDSLKEEDNGKVSDCDRRSQDQ